MSEVTYTVLGYHESNGQVFAIHVEAKDGTDALRKVAEGDSDQADCILFAALCGKIHEEITHHEGAHNYGAITFAGESVVDAETYLTNFEGGDDE